MAPAKTRKTTKSASSTCRSTLAVRRAPKGASTTAATSTGTPARQSISRPRQYATVAAERLTAFSSSAVEVAWPSGTPR